MLWDLYVGAYLHVYPLYSRIFNKYIFLLCREKPEGSTGKLGGEIQL